MPGWPPKLSAAQLQRLSTLIVGTEPRQVQFACVLWTREMVQESIRGEFGGRRSAGSVGRLLGTLGLSPQRPLGRAWQADPEAVEGWQREQFPAIRAAAKREGATI